MSLEQLAELFKWMSLINIGIFFLSVMVIMSMKKPDEQTAWQVLWCY